MSMVCPLELLSSGEKKLWVQPNLGSLSTQRPICLQLGKETTQSLKCLGSQSKEIVDLQNTGLDLQYRGETVRVRVRSTMADRKGVYGVTGLGGAYCDLCFLSKEEGHELGRIEDLSVSRTLESTQEICRSLGVDEEGEIKTKKTGDYSVRCGVMRNPVIETDIESTQTLHLLLRSCDFVVKLISLEIAEILHWSEQVRMRDTQFVVAAKKELQEHLKLKTGLKLDFPDATGKGGTTTTGNVARRILWEKEVRELALELIPVRRREMVRAVVVRIGIILRFVGSKNKIEKVESLESFCKETYRLILTSFPQPVVVISPSVHKLLGHSWELVEKNGGMGLGVLTEGGLEACNKILRNCRVGKARKDSQLNNLTDCQARLFRMSDPVLESMRQKLKPFCSICGIKGHHTRYCPLVKNTVLTQEDALVESFFT